MREPTKTVLGESGFHMWAACVLRSACIGNQPRTLRFILDQLVPLKIWVQPDALLGIATLVDSNRGALVQTLKQHEACKPNPVSWEVTVLHYNTASCWSVLDEACKMGCHDLVKAIVETIPIEHETLEDAVLAARGSCNDIYQYLVEKLRTLRTSTTEAKQKRRKIGFY